MQEYTPIMVLPVDFQQNWKATLQSATPTADDSSGVGGVFRLVNIRRTQPKTFEEQRLIVLVIDENGFPLPNIKVAFSFSTANQYLVSSDFKWAPPQPFRADVVATTGGGQIEHVQGSIIKEGQPGGITVYIVEPKYSSDVVTGMGMLADHTGVHLTFQLKRNGVQSINDRFAAIEARLAALEGT